MHAADFADAQSRRVVVGVLPPLLTSVAQQPSWSRPTRVAVAVAAAVVFGVLTVLASGDITSGATLAKTIATVLVAAQASYESVWKPSGIASAIEHATSTKPSGTETSNAP